MSANIRVPLHIAMATETRVRGDTHAARSTRVPAHPWRSAEWSSTTFSAGGAEVARFLPSTVPTGECEAERGTGEHPGHHSSLLRLIDLQLLVEMAGPGTEVHDEPKHALDALELDQTGRNAGEETAGRERWIPKMHTL
jgi:hypothetical protein